MSAVKNDVIRLDKTRGARLIEQNYILTCGLCKDKPAIKKIYPHAMECLDAVMKKADIKAVVSEYAPECIRPGELVIEQEHFSCPALEKISSEIISVICFAITSGDIYTDNIRVLDQAYFDICGTAVTDATCSERKLPGISARAFLFRRHLVRDFTECLRRTW